MSLGSAIFQIGGMAIVIGGASLSLGCKAQVDSAYQGEPIATLRGSVVTQDQPVPSGISAGIIYIVDQSHPEPSYVGARTSVAGSYPANFTLNIYDPPPAEAEWLTENADGGVGLPDEAVPGQPLGIWTGYLVALSPSWTGPGVQPGDIVGVDTSHTLLYFDHDVPDTADLSSLDYKDGALKVIASVHHVSPTKGYHLARIDSAVQNALAQSNTCGYGNVCVKATGATGFAQSSNDWNYARCHELLPNNPTCDLTVDSGAYPSFVAQCPSWQEPNCTLNFPSDAGPFDDNPSGLADPATVYLGKTIWDIFLRP
jgi:hypothetical protein